MVTDISSLGTNVGLNKTKRSISLCLLYPFEHTGTSDSFLYWSQYHALLFKSIHLLNLYFLLDSIHDDNTTKQKLNRSTSLSPSQFLFQICNPLQSWKRMSRAKLNLSSWFPELRYCKCVCEDSLKTKLNLPSLF